MAANHRFSPSRFDVRCVCGAQVAKDTPAVYDGEVKKTVRCASCPDLTGAEKREIDRVNAAEETKRRNAAENERRARESAGDVSEYIKLAGPTFALAVPMIRADAGILADCARHSIEVDTLVSSLLHLSAAEVTRANCSTPSWHAVAVQCAAWGLIPTLGADTPVYVFCRDTKLGKLSAERTRWGFALQISRALDDAQLHAGWVFAPEAILGDLARRITAGKAEARAEADALRARLEARAGETDPDRIALASGFRAYFDEDRAFPIEHKPALARAGKVADEPLRGALRAVYGAMTLTPEQREELITLRMDLDAVGSSLRPDEAALLAALQMPDWTSHLWYTASGPAEERSIEYAPPSLALWPRPPMDVRRIDGVPVVWWARLRYTENGVRKELGFELSRTAVYERAVAGNTVTISSAGLLVKASANQSPWLTWHGEMGAVKCIREMLKANPTLLMNARLSAAIGTIEDEAVIEGERAPVVGVDHLRERRKALLEMGPEPVDYAAETERLAQRVPVERVEG